MKAIRIIPYIKFKITCQKPWCLVRNCRVCFHSVITCNFCPLQLRVASNKHTRNKQNSWRILNCVIWSININISNMAVLFPLAKPIQRNFVCALKLLLQSHFKLLFLFVINISFGFVIIGDISLGVVKQAQQNAFI